LYGLTQQYPVIVRSTLHLFGSSALTAIVRGDLFLSNGLRIRVLEVLNFRTQQIEGYSYAVYEGETKIRWYDPQPHPESPALAGTIPHHFHQEPDIKHNRQPAAGISFDTPNFATLIGDCIAMKSSA
jgi:hypothetical protein